MSAPPPAMHRPLAVAVSRRDGRPARRAGISAIVASDPGRPVDGITDRPHRHDADPRWVNGMQVIARLGSGGTAEVYYAQPPTGPPVALKLFRADDRTTDVCRREFQLGYAVDGRYTAAPLGYGVAPAGAYLTTTYRSGYRSGTTLLDVAIPPDRLWAIAGALATALAGVHASGVVHCDVKPSNLLIRDDDIRVIDFGIARYVGQQCGHDGLVECSRGWAAPEQLHNGPATAAVDVFAWGCVVATLAAGVHPYTNRNDYDWILRVLSADPDLHGLPARLEDAIRHALDRDPHNRPTAAELARYCRAGT